MLTGLVARIRARPVPEPDCPRITLLRGSSTSERLLFARGTGSGRQHWRSPAAACAVRCPARDDFVRCESGSGTQIGSSGGASPLRPRRHCGGQRLRGDAPRVKHQPGETIRQSTANLPQTQLGMAEAQHPNRGGEKRPFRVGRENGASQSTVGNSRRPKQSLRIRAARVLVDRAEDR